MVVKSEIVTNIEIKLDLNLFAAVGYQVVEAGLATHLVASNLLGELQQELQALGLKARQFATLEALFLKYQVQSCIDTH